jgi:crotonobetainyl-CoA:carnitine CoA-transferase CaiB-like acyl-CoA transferase
MGADAVNVCPHSHYETSDGKWIAIACTSDAMFARLAEAMGKPDLASAEKFGPKEQRLGARDEVNAIVARWVASLDLETVLKRCAEGGVPASLIYSIADIFEDPQYRARGNIKTTESRIGALAVPDRTDARRRSDLVTSSRANPSPLAGEGGAKRRMRGCVREREGQFIEWCPFIMLYKRHSYQPKM